MRTPLDHTGVHHCLVAGAGRAFAACRRNRGRPPPRRRAETDDGRRPGRQAPKKRRNPWIWVSAGLGLVAAGLLIWALTTQSDLDSAQQDSEELQSQVDQGKETGSAVVAEVEAAYDDVTQQLGATNEDLAKTEQDLEQAEQDAAQAEQGAAAAKQDAAEAENETDKAAAEAAQAKSEAEAANSKTAIAAECAQAFASALGTLFEGESASAELESISATCKTALEGA